MKARITLGIVGALIALTVSFMAFADAGGGGHTGPTGDRWR
jgi:hypothetical protein